MGLGGRKFYMCMQGGLVKKGLESAYVYMNGPLKHSIQCAPDYSTANSRKPSTLVPFALLMNNMEFLGFKNPNCRSTKASICC